MKNFRFTILFLFLGFGSIFNVYAQNQIVIDGYTILPITVIDGDTLPHALIPQIVVFPTRKFTSNRDFRQYQRLIRNLKIVYPYAVIARVKISEMDAHFRSLDNDLERKAYAKQVEKELRDEFEGQLVELTITQGRLLIKLIDREVGRTSYDIIKEIRGGVSAVFWQAVARIFGSNLKSQFDSASEDKLLNELIILHEHGLL
jgi:hypothetical protein